MSAKLTGAWECKWRSLLYSIARTHIGEYTAKAVCRPHSEQGRKDTLDSLKIRFCPHNSHETQRKDGGQRWLRKTKFERILETHTSMCQLAAFVQTGRAGAMDCYARHARNAPVTCFLVGKE